MIQRMFGLDGKVMTGRFTPCVKLKRSQITKAQKVSLNTERGAVATGSTRTVHRSSFSQTNQKLWVGAVERLGNDPVATTPGSVLVAHW
jgi:hypothetical protein